MMIKKIYFVILLILIFKNKFWGIILGSFVWIKCTMTFRWIQVILLVLVSSVCAFETSEEYLRKAMHELQGIQAPLYPNYPFFAGKRYSRTANSLQVQQDTRPGYPPKKSEPEVNQYYPQVIFENFFWYFVDFFFFFFF